MTRKELACKLFEKNVPVLRYNIRTDCLEDDRLNLLKIDDRWLVCNSENGVPVDEKWFKSESEACEYFLRSMSFSYAIHTKLVSLTAFFTFKRAVAKQPKFS